MKNKLTFYLIGLFIVHLFWFLASILLNNNALVNPILVYQNIFFDFDTSLISHTFASSRRVFISLLIALSSGIIIALLMDQFNLFKKITNPIIYLLYPIPKPALLAIIMSLQGIGDESKITIIVLITFFQIVIYLESNLGQIPINLKYPLKSLGATNWKIVRHLKNTSNHSRNCGIFKNFLSICICHLILNRKLWNNIRVRILYSRCMD